MILLRGRFGSDISLARGIVADILASLKDSAPVVTPDDEHDVRLILSELILNAMIHGNKAVASKTVSVDARFEGGVLCCEIADEGDGFDHIALFEEFKDETKDVLASDHGRGINLAFALSDYFAYNEKGTAVTFHKRIARGG